MPKRNPEQQSKHNESRRKFVRESKKALFCIKHLQHTHPSLVKEAYKIYDYLYKLYPGKRDLTRTEIYCKQIMGKKNKQVEPVLNIPLLQTRRPTEQMEASSTQASTTGMPPKLPVMTDDETTALIRELQTDSDLKHFFDDEALYQETVPAETEPEGVQSLSTEEEIDRIIRQEFENLGNDLLDLVSKDEELMC